MGLDIYFESKKRRENDSENQEVAYFRKHNHLLPYFGYGENCEDCVVSKEQVEDFITDCKAVLEHCDKPDFEEVAKGKIPTQTGFFFGCYEYDDYYKEKLEHDLETFQNLLETFDWGDDELIMYCSW